jgi:hypothetical protein
MSKFNHLLDFLFVEKDWLYSKYSRLEFVRSPKYYTFKAALNLFLQNDGNLIVETGTQRLKDDPAGCSTLLFGDFCKRYGKHLITVDINPVNLEVSKQCTAEFKDYITYVLSDSVEFLRHFRQPIDLLYLDSLDCPAEGDASEAQKHNLNELKAAYKNLHQGSVVLLDDNNFQNGGKTRLSKHFLLSTGEWFCILDSGQSLWVKV